MPAYNGFTGISLGAKLSAQSISVTFATDASLPVTVDLGDKNYGTPGAATQRVASMLGVGSTAVSNANPVPVSDAGGSLTVDGTVAATQSGTWNITNLSGTVSLPTGAATETTLAALSAKHPATLGQKTMAASMAVTLASDQSALAITVASLPLPSGAATETTLAAASAKLPATLGQKTMAASMAVVLASDQTSIPVSNFPTTVSTDSGASGASTLRTVLATRHEAAATPVSVRISNGTAFTVPNSVGRAKVDLIRKDYSAGSVSTVAYTQLIASTSGVINQLDIFDSSGQTMVLAIGAAASEVDTYYIAPGGNGKIDLAIAAGSRISVKAVSATASVGELTITTLS